MPQLVQDSSSKTVPPSAQAKTISVGFSVSSIPTGGACVQSAITSGRSAVVEDLAASFCTGPTDRSQANPA